MQSHTFKSESPIHIQTNTQKVNWMADRPRFGPAGVPPLFRILGARLPDVPGLLREEGLDAFEYEAVRWGQAPQMRREEAEKLGPEARKNDVLLSLHGTYY